MPYLLFWKRRQNLKLSTAASYRWRFPYGKKYTAVNNFRKQLANTLRLFGKHNLIWLTSIRGMFARCSLFTCKLGLPRILLVNSLRIFSEYVANMIQDSKLNMQRICRKHSANMQRTCSAFVTCASCIFCA